MKSYNIAVIPGDGTGPEVVAEGIKVLNAASEKFGFKLDYTHFDFGGERYLRTGEVLPNSAVPDLKKFQAIFLGAIGHPRHRLNTSGESVPAGAKTIPPRYCLRPPHCNHALGRWMALSLM